MAADFGVLTDEELVRLDAAYQRFPTFAEWVESTSVDGPDWDDFRELLERQRRSVAPAEVDAARTFVMRAAALDTGALEGLYTTDRGFTFTVAQQAVHWERALSERGPLAVELFEAQLRAYELVLDAATQNLPVTEAWMRRLHEELCSPQETYTVHTPVGVQQHPLKRGAYKEHPNHVRLPSGQAHSYAPVDHVADEMHRLVQEAQSAPFLAAHPAHQASYVHYALVVIHPFADGNGRVARALSSTYYYRALSVPLIVLHEQRDEYLDALVEADSGSPEVFVTFIRERAIDAVQLTLDALASPASATPEVAAEQLRQVLTTQSGLTHQQLDVLAARCLGSLGDAVRTAVSQLPVPAGVTHASGGGYGRSSPPPGFRVAITAGDPDEEITFTSQSPAEATVRRRINVYVSTAERATFQIVLVDDTGRDLPIRLSEVSPVETPAFRLRLTQWAERLVASMLEEVTAQATESLRTKGFL